MTEQLLVEIEILKKKLAEWEKKKADGLICSTETIEQFKWERDMAIHQLKEIGKGFGEKMDDVKEALILLEKKEKAEKVADKLGRLLCDEYDYWNSNEGIADRKEAQRLLDLQAEGRIIELPVPIGTEVWLATADKPYSRTITKHQILLLLDWWGTYMFATKEEAEARLKEVQNEK